MKLKDLLKTWYPKLEDFTKSKQFSEIGMFLARNKGNLYPTVDKVFRPFAECSFDDLKVVIVNDTPFESETANDGLALSFSHDVLHVPKDAIAFKEGIERDFDSFDVQWNYDLKRIANQGVLLLNSAITSSKNGETWEHHHDTWSPFINKVIHTICQEKQGVIFIMMGAKYFKTLAPMVINSPNYIVMCMHPKEANHFAQVWNPSHAFWTANQILESTNQPQINWI